MVVYIQRTVTPPNRAMSRGGHSTAFIGYSQRVLDLANSPDNKCSSCMGSLIRVRLRPGGLCSFQVEPCSFRSCPSSTRSVLCQGARLSLSSMHQVFLVAPEFVADGPARPGSATTAATTHSHPQWQGPNRKVAFRTRSKPVHDRVNHWRGAALAILIESLDR